MPSELIRNGMIQLAGHVVDDMEAGWYGSGVFSPSMLAEALEEVSGDVVIQINSPGGDPVQAEAMRVMLQQHDGEVTVQVVGDASSAASMLIMGADRIEVSRGSIIMVHNPASCMCGQAEQLRAQANVLDVLTSVYAGVYAQRTGQTLETVLDLMTAETWMPAEQAIELGFADAMMASDLPDATAELSMLQQRAQARFQTVQANMLAKRVSELGVPSAPLSPAAPSGLLMASVAATEEANMPDPNPAVTAGGAPQTPATPSTAPATTMAAPTGPTTEEIQRQERARITAIMTAARPHVASSVINDEFVDGLIGEGLTVEMSSHRILERLSGSQPDITMRQQPARVGREDVETRREGLQMALTARLTGEAENDPRARPYNDMSFVEMAAVSMGQALPRHGSFASREEILMSAMHTTSDFTNILAGSINRVLEARYELTGRTFTPISREMQFEDFREHTIVRADNFPSLTKVGEAGEIKFGTFGENGEKLVLGAYASGVAISRQAMVNDDLGALQDVIDNAAAVIPEFEESVFWDVLNGNPTMADGVALFHANHGNLASTGAAISETTVSDGRKAMRKQRSADKKRVVGMNLPGYLIVGPDNETAADKFVTAVLATATADVNTFAGKLQTLVTETIDGNAWYLAVGADKRTHAMKHGYLRGRRAPRVRVEEPFGRQGTQMTLEHDFAAGAADHRGIYKNAGQ